MKIRKVTAFVQSESFPSVLSMIKDREVQENGNRQIKSVFTHEVGDFVRGVTTSGRSMTLYLSNGYLIVDFGSTGSESWAGEILSWMKATDLEFDCLKIETIEGGIITSLQEAFASWV